jgi:hypothetical protein
MCGVVLVAQDVAPLASCYDPILGTLTLNRGNQLDVLHGFGFIRRQVFQ